MGIWRQLISVIVTAEWSANNYMAGEAAECYDRTAVLEKQDGIELLELLAPKKRMVVLDLGCGPGYHANLFAQQVGPEGIVIGVDPDKERIKIAKEKYQQGNSLQYLEGNSKNFPCGNYDIIFSNHVVHWIKDKRALFKRVCENLSPGGRFAFVVVTEEGGAISVFLRQLLGEERARAVLNAFRFVPQEAYEALAVENGLEVTYTVATTHSGFKFKNTDALLDYIDGIFHGRVNGLKSVNKDILEKIKAQHGEEPVMPQYACCTFILTKPNY